MKKIVFRFLALVLVMILLASNSCVFLQANAISSTRNSNTQATEEVNDNAWMDNILTDNPLGRLGFKKSMIYSVTFLDNLDNVPEKPWHMGNGSSSRVKGWIEWNGGMAEVYFAAEGGINGENACESLFEDCINLEVINFNGAFHTDTADSMSKMFRNCKSLEEVDIETLDTSSVKDMSEMFYGCTSLEEIDTKNFNTENVTTMCCMFSICTAVEELDLSNFDTSKVTNMGFMFSACRSLVSVDVTSFDTSRVTTMEGMFRWCESLEYVDITDWDLSRVKVYSNFMDPGIYYDGKPWEKYFK